MSMSRSIPYLRPRHSVGKLGLSLIVLLAGLIGCARAPRQAPAPVSVQQAPTDYYAQALQQTALLRTQSPIMPDRGYRIGPNDIVEIKVYDQDKMDTTVRVGGDSTIRFAALGMLNVAGLSERELETLIENGLRGKYLTDPHVNVFVKEPHSRKVAIVGEVKTPGLYPIYGEESLVDVISKAGGITEKAGNTAFVIRNAGASGRQGGTTTTQVSAQPIPGAPGARSIKVDLNGLLLRGEQQWNIRIFPGDCVTIPDAGWIHVTGKGIFKAGTYPLKSTTPNTLRQFIDEAGGLRFSANRTFYLARRTPGAQDEFIRVKYNRILSGKNADIPVQNGDTIIVNRNPVKTVVGGIGQFLAMIFRVSLYYNFAVDTQ